MKRKGSLIYKEILDLPPPPLRNEKNYTYPIVFLKWLLKKGGKRTCVPLTSLQALPRNAPLSSGSHPLVASLASGTTSLHCEIVSS